MLVIARNTYNLACLHTQHCIQRQCYQAVEPPHLLPCLIAQVFAQAALTFLDLHVAEFLMAQALMYPCMRGKSFCLPV